MKYIKNVITATTLVLSSNVNAALLSVDWLLSGDNLVTRDTTNGLEWLDMTETANMSFNFVSGQLGEGAQFEGWRYATNLEVASLFVSFGLPTDAHLSNVGPVDAAIVDFSNTMGNIMNDSNPTIFSYGARGFIGESNGTNMYQAGAYYATSSSTNIYVGPYLGGGSSLVSPSASRGDLGSYLVRDAAVVPIPAAVWLFGSGLLGLVGVARCKKA